MSDLIPQLTDGIALIEDGEASPEQVLLALQFSDRLGQIHRDLKTRLEAAVITFIKRHGDLDTGTVRYYVGTEKKTECVDQKNTVGTVLEMGGPDLLATVLSSGALKPGPCKEVLGEDWGKHFVVRDKDDLKAGKPVQRLKKHDPRFME